MSTEKERETQVYLAKLAEQAERYEGFVRIDLFVLFKDLLMFWMFVVYITLINVWFVVLIWDSIWNVH